MGRGGFFAMKSNGFGGPGGRMITFDFIGLFVGSNQKSSRIIPYGSAIITRRDRTAERNARPRMSTTSKASCLSLAMPASSISPRGEHRSRSCSAHTRRKFYEVARATNVPIAMEDLPDRRTPRS
ncbi:hypothetical protein MES4922_40361 [Mesorhizobium ventifaucium]|uniref:Uncharacterized protein n=1 Tax=Mesorhizobium ventifaucium TaxID=666020 RepID=A0ABM9EA32_9HYPH|nr:hypothetical protein MES4922_40361 [Mesorhizobium ventifaucium]